MPSSGTLLLLGLPSSGRQTFLAALWHQLESAEMPTSMVTSRLQQDREYLNRIREAWLACEDIQTAQTQGIDPSATLHLKQADTGTQVDISIPYVSDQTLEIQWTGRRAPRAYVDAVRQSIGTLLFIHPSHAAAARPTLAQPGRLPASGTATPAEWERAHAPSQVRLIDLLQTILGITSELGEPTRLAILISAWDSVTDPVTPPAWLERALPLLDQFRLANAKMLVSEVYGISAMGGGDADREELASADLPSTRVRVHVGSQVHKDLTLPIEFATMYGKRL